MDTDTYHQLIVLGNGFDLSCGLSSSFSAFFEPRMRLVEERESLDLPAWAKSLRDAGLTAWDLILHSWKQMSDGGGLVNWCDVEGAISYVVMMSDSDQIIADAAVTVQTVVDYFTFLDNLPDAVGPHDFAKLVERGELDDWKCGRFDKHAGAFQSSPNAITRRVGTYLSIVYPHGEHWGEDDVCDVLFEELGRLEVAFDVYLGEVMQSHGDYESNSRIHLREMICEGLDEYRGLKTTFDILDFNYTSPGIPDIINSAFGRLINVHGSLGSEIIFGADGTGHMRDGRAVRFSKTYRVARLGRRDVGSPVAYRRRTFLPGETETFAIKFYGHSLAKADYAYFQSIFDMVDLYEGTVRLYFYYKNHKEGADEECLMRVANLLDAYGSTLDNRDHGKNLMHKLLLEGRLVVKELVSTIM